MENFWPHDRRGASAFALRPVRVYRPPGAASREVPGLLWMHGGAFVAGDLDMPEAHVVSAELASRGAIVVSVDYRLATATVRYPVPLDDVHAAWGWFADVTDDLGTDPRQLAIGGASAGANLAAAATLSHESVDGGDEAFAAPGVDRREIRGKRKAGRIGIAKGVNRYGATPPNS